MYVLKKRLKDANIAHFLGKEFPRACKFPHGHSYHFEIEVGATKLDQYDMIIDFSIIKEVCDNFIQDNWDHATVFSSFQTEQQEYWKSNGWRFAVFPIENRNTTAESMSEFLATKFAKELVAINDSIKYVTMRVWETDTSCAEFRVDL